MLVQVVGYEVESKEGKIKIFAENLESILLADNLDLDAEAPQVTFSFSNENNAKELKYLMKILASRKECRNEHTLKNKLNKFVGVIININTAFIEAA